MTEPSFCGSMGAVRCDDRLVLAEATASTPSRPMALSAIVIQMLWSDSRDQPWSQGDLQRTMDVVGAWFRSVSYGRFEWKFAVAPFIRLPAPGDGNGASFSFSAIRSQLIAVDPKYNPDRYDRRIYLTPGFRPKGEPQGQSWGSGSWLNCGDAATLTRNWIHESGHMLGLPHPQRLNVAPFPKGNWTMPPIDWVDDGKVSFWFQVLVTGDPGSMMSYEGVFNGFSAPEREAVGWLTPMLYTEGDQTYKLRPLSEHGDAVRIDRVGAKGAQRTYWVEYRQPTSSDSNLAPDLRGVHVRVATDLWHLHPPALVNGALRPNQSFTDGDIAIDIVSETPEQATIRIHRSTAAVVAVADRASSSPQESTSKPVATSSLKASPAGSSITMGDAKSLVDSKGSVWTISSAPLGAVVKDGVGADVYWARELKWTGERIEAVNKDNGSRSYWNGSRWVGM